MLEGNLLSEKNTFLGCDFPKNTKFSLIYTWFCPKNEKEKYGLQYYFEIVSVSKAFYLERTIEK